MKSDWLAPISKHVFYPLLMLKHRSRALKYCAEYEEEQWLPREDLEKRQWTKVQGIIQHAYSHSPFYKRIMDKESIDPAQITKESFLKFPIMDKKAIRQNMDTIVSNAYKKEDLCVARTGGSTGRPLKLYFDRICQMKRNGMTYHRDKWANWDFGYGTGRVWGKHAGTDPTLTWKRWVKNKLVHRIIPLDTYNLNPDSMEEFLENCAKENVKFIYGHPHAMSVLAEYIRDKRKKALGFKLEGIVTTAMILLKHEREIIQDVFKCPAFDRYGCEEVGLISSECEQQNGHHINIHELYVEFVDDAGEKAKPGSEANILVTDLSNHGMPLIRYKLDDKGIYSDRVCDCGRKTPLLEEVLGRRTDFLVKDDGALVSGNSILYSCLLVEGISHIQIEQTAIGKFSLNIVISHVTYNMHSEQQLKRSFCKVFGESIEFDIQYVDEILPSESGKYRLVSSLV